MGNIAELLDESLSAADPIAAVKDAERARLRELKRQHIEEFLALVPEVAREVVKRHTDFDGTYYWIRLPGHHTIRCHLTDVGVTIASGKRHYYLNCALYLYPVRETRTGFFRRKITRQETWDKHTQYTDFASAVMAAEIKPPDVRKYTLSRGPN